MISGSDLIATYVAVTSARMVDYFICESDYCAKNDFASVAVRKRDLPNPHHVESFPRCDRERKNEKKKRKEKWKERERMTSTRRSTMSPRSSRPTMMILGYNIH